MAYDSTEARREMLDTIATAADHLGAALAALGEAYEQLDETNADRLEEELFRGVQGAYGRAKRTYAEFAARHDLPARAFAQAEPGHPSTGVKGFIEVAVAEVLTADHELAELQDSMRPVDVGDAELRAGLSEVRRLIDGLPGRARRVVAMIGR